MTHGVRGGPATLSADVLVDALRAVQAIAQAASAEAATLDPAGVAREATAAMVRVTGLAAVSIHVADRPEGVARCIAQTGYPDEFLARFNVLPLEGDTLTARALRSGEPQYSGASMPTQATHDALALASSNTFIIVPFRSGGKVSGTVNVVGVRDSDPTAEEIALLQIVAEQIGHAVGATRLHVESTLSNRRAHFLADVSRAFSATLDLPHVLDVVARRATEVLGDWCVIYLRDEAEELMPMRAVHHRDPRRVEIVRSVFAARPVRVGEGIAGTVVLSGQPRVFPEFDEAAIRTLAPRDNPAYMAELRQVRSWACLPLMSRGHGVGAIVIATSGRTLEDDDLEFAAAFAEIAAGAIENARLYDTERNLRIYSEAARAQLEAADKQKDEFLSIASHELRTPLTSAQGFAQVLLRRLRRDPDADRQQLEGLTIMEAQLRRIGALLNDLLDFSRIQDGALPLRRAPMDIVALVLATVERSRSTPGSDRITLTAPPEPVHGVWDHDRIEQILVNLLENAIKYSPGGGSVDVSVGTAAGWAIVRVRDHGLGIPPDARAQLFQRYFRVQDVEHQQINGIGVGLYISRDLAERHSGAVELEQPDGRGSIFVLRLPLDEPAAAAKGD